MMRQLGMARILAIEYGVDFSSLNEKGKPDYFLLFDGCDSTEPCQSLIIQFMKEFKIDVHRQWLYTGLHFAVLHKLFTVVKFLVEECKVDKNCVCYNIVNGTPLHMAYGIGEESIAQYLIEHGANEDALDNNGKKPIDYKLYWNSTNCYAYMSQIFIKRRIIKKDFFSEEHLYFQKLHHQQGLGEIEAIELTFKMFPFLLNKIDKVIVGPPNFEAIPTQRELNPYITDMAPFYAVSRHWGKPWCT